MTKQILSWHNDQSLKAKTIAEMQAHIEADRLVKGQYWENGKGCAVGCLIQSSDHSLYASIFGIPKELAELEDGIFEGLPNNKAMQWPIEFLNAVPVGVPIDELRKVWNRFAVWLLVDPDHGVAQYNDSAAIKRVAELHAKAADGIDVSLKDWEAAEKEAREAAWAAARDAAREAAREAARAAAWAAARAAAWAAEWEAAREAAWAAARDAAGEAARAAAWAAEWEAREAAREAARAAQADKLLELLTAERQSND